GQAEAARNFHDRLFEFDAYRLRAHNLRRRDPAEAAMQEVYDLHWYAEIVVAAWALYLAGEPNGQATGASLFADATREFATRHEVVRVWEVMGATSPAGAAVNAE